jgi:glucose-1-phosphate thymidylyltransferase
MPAMPIQSATRRRLIGLLPAAGFAKRLGPLSCSKEIYPIPIHSEGGEPRTKAVGQFLLEKMRRAGIERAFIVIREGKWDIPAHFRDGAPVNMHIGYLITTVPWGTPYTLDQAYPFVRDNLVALGFPDIIFSTSDAYERLIAHQARTGADVVLGLFPADRPATMDVVDVGADNRVKEIRSKPAQTTLTRTWGIALWTPSFTAFLHERLRRSPAPTGTETELSIGEVIQAGLTEGLTVEGVSVSDEPFVDIGLPENLERVLKEPSFIE